MPYSRLILALDVPEREKALSIANVLGPFISYIKINWPLILSAGADIIQPLSKIKPVICDLKLADIPNTTRLITEEIVRRGAFGVIAHAFVGSDSLLEIAKTAPDIKTFAVVAMSHPGSSELMVGETDRLIRIAKAANVFGVIAPGNNVDLLRHVRESLPEKIILAPGVGAQGGDAQAAIKAGADYIIVGRQLYNSEQPAEAAREILESIA